MSYIFKYKKPFIVDSYVNSIFNQFKYFKLDEYTCMNIHNRSLNNEHVLFLCEHRPFGKWFLHHAFNDSHTVFFGGIFSLDKRDILQHPIQRYIQLENELSISSNPEVGHYIERAWGTIFGPLKHTILNTHKI